jgi:hypothetical protein
MIWPDTISIIGAMLIFVASALELWVERGLKEICTSARLIRLEEKVGHVFSLLAAQFTKDPSNKSRASYSVNFDAAAEAFAPVAPPLAEKQVARIARARISIQLIGGLLVIIGTLWTKVGK